MKTIPARLAVTPVLVLLPILAAPSAMAIPTVVSEFNSLYVGVDGTGSKSVSGTETYDFVGLGVRSTDPLLTGNSPFAGNPVGVLDVATGATLNLNYLPGTIGAPIQRPLDNSVLVGNSVGATGTLNVTGGDGQCAHAFCGAGRQWPSLDRDGQHHRRGPVQCHAG